MFSRVPGIYAQGASGLFVPITYLDTDGTLAADSDARVPTQKAVNTKIAASLSSRPAFAATKGGTNQTGLVDATTTKLTFTSELYDNGGYYDAANSKWTPPAGIAFIGASMQVETANIVDQNEIVIRIYKNGAAYKNARLAASGTSVQPILSISTQLVVNGTDYFEIYAEVNTSGGTATIQGSGLTTEFFGHMVAVN